MPLVVKLQLILTSVSSLSILLLSGFVYLKNPHSPANRTYSLATLFAGGWVISHALIVLDSVYNFTDPTLLGRLTFIFVLALPTWLLFTQVFPRPMRPIGIKKLTVLYFVPILITIGGVSPFIVKRLTHRRPGWTDWDMGWGYVLFAVCSFIYIALAIYNLIKRFAASKGITRLQIKYILFGGTITTLSVFVCNIFLVAVFDYDRLVPYGAVSILALSIATAYAILRYRLMNIELIVSRTAFFIITVSLIFAFHIAFVAALQSRFGYFASSVLSIILIIFVFSFTPLREKIQGVVDSLIFRGRYDYQKVLREASKALVTILDLDQLLDYFIKIIVQNIGVRRVALFLVEEEKASYTINASYGISKALKNTYELSERNGIIKWLKENKSVFVKEEMERRLREEEFKAIYSNMGALGAELTMPLFYKGRLLGILNLDYKDTGDIYTKEDLQVLDTIASEAAVAIENARLYTEAITDGLTHLYHHKYFQHRLGEEVERTKRYNYPVSLLMLDVDRFKELNDKYGHQLGDLILKDVAKILKSSTRVTDIVARYGGEEFAIILPETPDKGVINAAERLRAHVESSRRRAEELRNAVEEYKIVYEGGEIGVTISIGIATYDGKDRNFTKDQLISKADAALYKAKELGRNRVEVG